jgi:hypothetical protein
MPEGYLSKRRAPEGVPASVVERYHALIEAVSRSMGFTDQIGTFDIRNGYYPDALTKMDQAAIIDAEEKIARRSGKPIIE